MKIDLRKRYSKKDYSPKTVETMELIIDSMERNFTEFDSAWISSLDLLAQNYEIMNAAYEDLKKNGCTSPGSRERLSKNPNVSLFLNCQNAIQNILSKTGLTVLSKARVKMYQKDDPDVEDEFESKFM